MRYWWDAFIRGSNEFMELEDACKTADKYILLLEERLAKRYKIDSQNIRARTGVL